MPSAARPEVTRHSAPGTRHWREIVGVLIIAVSRWASAPKTFWESDELLFAAAVKKFEPLASHPHPPGYPLYVGIGKLAAAITGDIFVALVAVSFIACVVGFVALALTFRRIVDDPDVAVGGALIFYFSAAMLVHGMLPMSDSPAIACAALALYAMTFFPDEATERTAIGLGLATSAAIGIRPQLVVPLLPVFLFVLIRSGNMRRIAVGLISFAVLSAAWFAQLVEATKGLEKFWLWMTHQAAYVAEHDAAASRGAHTAGEVASRFIFHPWGPKSIALPIMFLALLGGIALFRRRATRALPLLAFCAIHIIFALEVMDPADGPRYALPALMGVALMVACGLDVVGKIARIRLVPIIGIVTITIVSWVYAAPIIVTRHRMPSPDAAAAAWANAHAAPNTVVLYDLSLRPQAEVLFERFRSVFIDKGLAAYYDRPDIPLLAVGDGGSADFDAKFFAWPESDAYGKLTRNHYRVITLDPITPNKRFLPVRGVYQTERTVTEEWRWLAPEAEIRLPTNHGRSMTVTFGLSHDVPYEGNDVQVAINGVAARPIHVPRHGTATAIFMLPDAPVIDIVIRSAQSFAPAAFLHNQDPRILAVQLIRVVQSQ